jgi:hypothetical protein
MATMKRAWCAQLAAMLFAVAAAGCAERSSSTGGGSSSGDDAPPFPKLASYDRSCVMDSDCALVPGEGCASCQLSALGAKTASSYTMSVAAASHTSECMSVIERASPCSVLHATAGCQASLCVVRYPVADAGAGADADASPLDASTD